MIRLLAFAALLATLLAPMAAAQSAGAESTQATICVAIHEFDYPVYGSIHLKNDEEFNLACTGCPPYLEFILCPVEQDD